MVYLYAAKYVHLSAPANEILTVSVRTNVVGLKPAVMFSAFVLLALHRLTTRWNQTGQKHAGEPDISHNFFPDHHIILWLLIITTYIHLAFRIGRRTFADIMGPELGTISAISLVLPSFVFKLNFTQADAPELVGGLAESIRAITSELDLVTQARAAFIGLSIATLVVARMIALGYGRDEDVRGRPSGRFSGKSTPLVV
jgi:ethanolaminephosphotransferase